MKTTENNKILQGRSVLTTDERRQSLLGIWRKQLGLRLSEIIKAFGVSGGTIRNALKEKGRLMCVHRGSILIEQNQFQNKSFIKIQLSHK